jgi:acetamidase/formamidase
MMATSEKQVDPGELLQLPKGEVRYTLGPEHPPVASVTPGTRLRIETELNIGDVIHSLDDRFDAGMLKLPFVNPVTGPVAVDGASRDQVLVCDIERIELTPPGFTALVPGFGPFVDWIRRRDFGVHARIVDVHDGEVIWDERTRIPVRPMAGTIGTAPLLDSISTIDNGPHGGNMDVQEIEPGARLYLPIEVDGALFYVGDCHAVQGDGELCGIGAIEIRTHTTVRLDLAPSPQRMHWPRIETETYIAAVASARPLEDAFRLAVEELVNWMTADYGFTSADAVLLLGQVAEARCTQVVNPKYTYIVKLPKRYLTGADN